MQASGLKGDLIQALDPVVFLQTYEVTPDPWQTQVLRTSADRVILNCSRQSGKSFISSVLGLHTAIYQAGSLVLLLSPSQRQSGELFRKVLSLYRRIEKDIPREAESALRLELRNGSRIVSLPGKDETIRGYSGAALIVVDEAARVPDGLYTAVRPMLAVSGGKLMLLSTPFGQQGSFHDIWMNGDEKLWLKVRVPASDCPRISEAFLARERSEMSDWAYRQEYECEFCADEYAVFSYEDIEDAIKSGVRQWKL